MINKDCISIRKDIHSVIQEIKAKFEHALVYARDKSMNKNLTPFTLAATFLDQM